MKRYFSVPSLGTIIPDLVHLAVEFALEFLIGLD